MRARVIDVESTGFADNPDSRVCEVGFVDVVLPDNRIDLNGAYAMLVNPGLPIPPEASAVHHILDEDVDGQPTLEAIIPEIVAGLAPDDIFVAHNAKTEQHFLPFITHRWVDTYKVGLRAWNDAPNHQNNTLAYWLRSKGGVKGFDRFWAQPTHRALPDAYVTAHIFMALWAMGRPLERLVDLSTQPGFLPKILFGKHAGMRFEEVPSGYLRWITEQADMDEDVKFTAFYWLKKKDVA